MKEKTKDRLVVAAFIVAILVLALLARLQFLPLKSGDYKFCLSAWMDAIREQGAWASLGRSFSDYSPAYLYIMCLVSGIGNTLYALKGVSIFFDYAAAVVMFFLAARLTGSCRKGIAAMAATLFCPTLIINSAWWCQCDIIYVTFMLLALLFLLKDKGWQCCLMLGIAFSFKVQALFFLPLLVILCVKGKTIKLWHLLLVPAVFFVSVIPAWIAGGKLGTLLTVYFLQAGEFPYATLHFPNIYEFLHETNMYWHHLKEVGAFGVYFSFGVLGIFAFWLLSERFRTTPQLLVTMALFSVCLVLFTMPHMHERYGLFVDILLIAYALQRPEKIPLAVGYIMISLLSYMPFINRANVLPGIWLAIGMLALNIFLGRDLARQIKENRIAG